MPSVLVYSTAPITTISEVKDKLDNALADKRDKWQIELKLYRANSASFQDTERAGTTLITVTTSLEKGKVFVYSRSSAIVAGEEMAPDMLSKMQSLWVLRQTFKCEGQVYNLDGVLVRVANTFVQGNYKGLLVEIESDSEDLLDKAKAIVSQCEIPGQVPDEMANSLIEKIQKYQVLIR
ncbi:Mediator of RNA polymerase II transcription subunit 20 [Wickerhamiella sorbophila]|uniref:Mediator of RNA polymerase II transcription subunit 20 n=1 Tax=Wickerhamiella sorbophila TaxID=45607 RepID=A0A2T0FHX4_9ASCO|nr:Mediator of RNA polymerase II transcription subunit 20 [Wickerhamiella sorbophila]PRT54601.1 Mediator of RNA polymerase II transcription subunit 20 [Wickerhamiella sorbophila]